MGLVVQLKSFLQRNVFTIAILSIAFAFIAYQRLPLWEHSSAYIGQTAPLFTLKDLRGESVSVGPPTNGSMATPRKVLYFWATWCSVCRTVTPQLVDLQKETSRDQGLIVAITQEDATRVSEFIAKGDMPLRTLIDPDGATNRNYQVEVLPTIVLVDEHGRIADIHYGFNPLGKFRIRKFLTGSYL